MGGTPGSDASTLMPGSYSVYNKAIAEVSNVVAEQKMPEAAKELHSIEGKPVDEVIDAVAILDGTWQK